MTLRRRLLSFFAAIAVVGAVALMPLGVGLSLIKPEAIGFSARATSGTVWSGRIDDAVIGPLALGDFDVRLSPLQLLLGRVSLALKNPVNRSEKITLVAVSGKQGFDHATLRIAAAHAFAPLPIDMIDLDDVSLRMANGRCVRASGKVRLGLGADLGGITLGQGLSGTLRCDSAAIGATLISQSAMERVLLRVTPRKGYRATIIVNAGSAERVAEMARLGFRETSQGMVMRVSGKF